MGVIFLGQLTEDNFFEEKWQISNISNWIVRKAENQLRETVVSLI